MKKRPADHARSENLAAEYVDGVLTIRLPVKASARPRGRARPRGAARRSIGRDENASDNYSLIMAVYPVPEGAAENDFDASEVDADGGASSYPLSERCA